MKVERIDVWHVALPLRTPWRTAYGSDSSIHSVIVRIASEGIEGWGEAAPLEAPTYSPQYAHATFDVICRFFAPALLGKELPSAEVVLSLLAHFKGNSFAKAALESAWWNLESQRSGTPLWRLLGGRDRRISVGADFQAFDDTGELLDSIARAVERGYPRVKLKVEPGREVKTVAAVRDAFPDLTIHIDCNSGYAFPDDSGVFRELDRFGLAMLEQPLRFDDFVGHAQLQQIVETPICLDESITSPAFFELALQMEACRIVNIKPARVGGLLPSCRILELARENETGAWVGGMLESGIGVRIAGSLAALEGFTYPADIFPSDRIHAFDISDPPVLLDEDCMLTTDEITRPYRVDRERLADVTVERSP